MTRAVAVLMTLTVLAPGPKAAQQAGPERNTPNTFKAAESVASPPATIQDMAWLAGEWNGPGLGGDTTETWSTPVNGAMMGMFRLVRDGKVVFYEFMTLIEHQGSLVMRIKHFNPDMTGWEEKANYVTFRLLKLEPDVAYFSGLTFKRVDPNRVDIFLALRDSKTGTVREERFEMTRRR